MTRTTAATLTADAASTDGTSTSGAEILGIAIRDLMAGHAIFTIVTNQTGVSHTYKISKSDEPNTRGVYTYFVALLSGPNNDADYTYMGLLVFDEPSKLWIVKPTKASRIGKDAQSFILISWLLRKLSRNLVHDYDKGARVLMAGYCLRCGRTLTVESSINAMYGPVCASKVWG